MTAMDLVVVRRLSHTNHREASVPQVYIDLLGHVAQGLKPTPGARRKVLAHQTRDRQVPLLLQQPGTRQEGPARRRVRVNGALFRHWERRLQRILLLPPSWI